MIPVGYGNFEWGYVQFVSLEYTSWACLGMLRVGAVLDKVICELNSNPQKAVVADERKLEMI
jgi:hypothetical protein